MVKVNRLPFELSIQLELLLSQLYIFLYDTFPQDASFWWRLALEEKSHAALIRSGLDYFLDKDLFPDDILAPTTEKLEKIVSRLKDLLMDFKLHLPTRGRAFEIAMELETSAGEAHFQAAMEKKGEKGILKIFQDLNRHDIEHYRRLLDYKNKYGI